MTHDAVQYEYTTEPCAKRRRHNVLTRKPDVVSRGTAVDTHRSRCDGGGLIPRHAGNLARGSSTPSWDRPDPRSRRGSVAHTGLLQSFDCALLKAWFPHD